MKILLAEDNHDIRRTLKSFIEHETKNLVIEAENGIDAFEKFKAQPFDLLITDIDMPIMNGLELISKIKNDIPIIIFSALPPKKDIIDKIAHHPQKVSIMEKPGDIDRLISKIKNLQKN